MVYITGNLHGELDRFDAPEFRRLKKGDTLLVCGDFGFLWDGSEKEKKQLKKLSNKKYTIAFVDGTHENFHLLNQYPVQEWNGGRVHDLGGVFHLMRGEIFTIEGKTYFAMGGGESAEKQMYMDAGNWWEQEMPTMEEIRSAAQHLKDVGMQVDNIVTHEPAPKILASGVNAKENTNQLESFFETVVRRVQYGKWFFGSLHTDRKFTAKNYAVFNRVLCAANPDSP